MTILQKRRFLYFSGLSILVFVFYWRFVDLFFIKDDFTWVENARIASRQILNIFTLDISHFFRPFTHLFMLLEYLLWGLNPKGYYFTQIIIHCLNSILFFYFLKNVLKINHPFLLFITPVVWATQLIHFEAVAWISAISNLLFVLLTLLTFLAFSSRSPKRKWFFLLAFLSALLTKEEAIILYPLIISYWFIFENQPFLSGNSWKKLLSFPEIIIAGLIWVIYFSTEIWLQANSPLVLEKTFALNFSGLINLAEKIFMLFFDLQPPITMIIPTFLFLTLYLVYFLFHAPPNIKRQMLFSTIFLFLAILPTSFFNYGNPSHYFYTPTLASSLIIVSLLVPIFDYKRFGKYLAMLFVVFLVIMHFSLFKEAELSVTRLSDQGKLLIEKLTPQIEQYHQKTFNFINPPFDLAHIYSLMNLYFEIPRGQILVNAEPNSDYINLQWE
ncbi:MAG: Conserved hypothetical tpr repeat protein [Candidatus Peregrinibacteria bacterium GW2011_GWE2_39_6]|nr:MAG: Conserved hypothetical tpr repeat protein [Candidatus Peregrinibacteria bacterium GW2011_GWF2_39_17]KKR25133.1 MAG: Conserved hypothetical tpr repeat protein [Candidatus Peregrinibacteria bacterium GW2011_GWE2_39_6]HCW31958.1 hypothetical protein [Candidatus Peregrinibacteria bacterium]